MRRRNRAARVGVRGHLTGALAAPVVGASVAIVLSGDPVSATAHPVKTVAVHFTDRSPKPESVQLCSGDSVTFVNRLSQSGKVRVDGVRAEVVSARVMVHGAARTDFLLAGDNDSQTLTYTGPQTVHYTATYTFTLRPVLNVLGANVAPETITIVTTGQLIVAAPEVSRAPAESRSKRHSQPPSPPGGGAGADQQSGAGGAPAGGAGSSTRRQAAPAAPPVVAAQVPDAWAGIGPPPGVLGSSTDRGALQLPRLPQLATSGPVTGASTGNPTRTAGLGLPALVAVGLLSVVTAALVRSLIIQRRAILL